MMGEKTVAVGACGFGAVVLWARGLAGERVWVVTGRNGENLLRTEGATQAEAWHRAVEQARELGMAFP